MTILQKGIQHNQPGFVELAGFFTTDSSGNVINWNIPGVESISRPHEGSYNFELREDYNAFLGLQVAFQSYSPVQLAYQINPDLSAQSGRVGILFFDYASPPARSNPEDTTIWVTIGLDNVASE